MSSNMSKHDRAVTVARYIEQLLPDAINPGYWDILDALEQMTPKQQLEALLEALEQAGSEEFARASSVV